MKLLYCILILCSYNAWAMKSSTSFTITAIVPETYVGVVSGQTMTITSTLTNANVVISGASCVPDSTNQATCTLNTSGTTITVVAQ